MNSLAYWSHRLLSPRKIKCIRGIYLGTGVEGRVRLAHTPQPYICMPRTQMIRFNFIFVHKFICRHSALAIIASCNVNKIYCKIYLNLNMKSNLFQKLPKSRLEFLNGLSITVNGKLVPHFRSIIKSTIYCPAVVV